MKSILYAFDMSGETENVKEKNLAKLTVGLGHPLFRFIIAGLLASLVTFALLFLMRYLIMGYDRSATEAITQYFTLRTVVLSDGGPERAVRVERPSERPELPAVIGPDFKQEAEAFLQEQQLSPPLLLLPQHNIEKEVQLPQLEHAPLSTHEELQRIKQQILSGEDPANTSP